MDKFKLFVGLFIALVVIGLSIAFYLMGNKNYKLTNDLKDTTAALQSSRARVGRLAVDSAKNVSLIAVRDVTIAQQQADNADMLTQAAKAELNSISAQDRVNAVVASMTALQKKQAADRLTGGIGPIATTIADTSVNGDVASLKGQVRSLRDTIVPRLTRAVAFQTKRADRAEEQVSDLEKELNGSKGALLETESALLGEAQTRRFLGTGRKKAMRKLAGEVRAIRSR